MVLWLSHAGLYRARTLILLKNVRKWHPVKDHPLVEIEVGVGLSASIVLKINAFDPIDPQLLEHINFRNLTSAFLRTTKTQPYGLWDFSVRLPYLDDFFEEMLPALIREKLESSNGSFMAKVLEVGYGLSQSVDKSDVRPAQN